MTRRMRKQRGVTYVCAWGAIWAAFALGSVWPQTVHGDTLLLPCRLAQLLEPGATIEAGGVRFSEFQIGREMGGPFGNSIVVEDASTAQLAGLTFSPLMGSFDALGDRMEKSVEVSYVASAIASGSAVRSADLGVVGNASGDSEVIVQALLLDAGQTGLATELGTMDAYIVPGFLEQRYDQTALTTDARIEALKVVLSIGVASFEIGSNASLVAAHQRITVVPEPRSSNLVVMGVIGALCAMVVRGWLAGSMSMKRRHSEPGE